MKFVWAGNREEKNGEIKFVYNADGNADTLVVCAADFFCVFADGEFISYGPERTAAGYARKREIILPHGAKEIAVYVSAYNVPCYSCDDQQPFFGAQIYSGDKLVADTENFLCFERLCRRKDVPRYSVQRGFVEIYDLTDTREKKLTPYAVDALVVLSGVGDTANYEKIKFEHICNYVRKNFDAVTPVWWEKHPICAVEKGSFDVKTDFFDRVQDLPASDYELKAEKTGFLRLEITAFEETEIFCAWEEILPDGKWIFRRSKTNDLACIKAPEGKTTFMSAEPYAMKYLRVFVSGKAEIKPSLVLLENSRADCVKVSGDEKFVKVFEAAKNTFKQNAVDILTDCPGRERAGWLCDSYFSGIAERLFTGKNDIERLFLENIILADCEELPQGILPKCFPAGHYNRDYIPNWAMWFVVELNDYFLRTGDKKTVDKAKDKVFGVIDFFERYINEYGLLENLESWIFVEWSVCNDPEYVKGVNYPSNMVYALMLESAGKLYGDKELTARAEKVRKAVRELAWNGEFFVDNATRDESGKLIRRDDHITETCQYYALFCGIETDEKFERKMAEEFGPFRKDAYPNVGRSNVFIGNYLRYFWLCGIGEKERVLSESSDYFSAMADKTGTLWENDAPSASCNHGFASVIAVLLLRCAIGYITVKDGKPVLDNSAKLLDITVEFDYDGIKTVV